MTAALPPDVAALEARPYAPESAVERVAQAMWEALDGYTSGVPWEHSRVWKVNKYRRLAVAALTAMRPAPDAPRTPDPAAALARVETWCDQLEESPAGWDRDIAGHLRFLIAGQP